ncbi:MAG: hypothetical protein AABZ47_06330, partial [Planctomycetota bacterium]
THRLGIDLEKARYQFKGMTQVDRAKYAMEHFTDDQAVFLEPETVRVHPEKAYTAPNFTRIAPELSAIGSKVTQAWLYSWLMEPKHYWPETKMPNLRLTSAEAADVAAYLMTLRHDSFAAKEFEMTADRRQMVDDLLMTLLTAQRSEKASRAILADQGEELTRMMATLMQGSRGRERAYEFARSLSLADKKLVYLGNKMVAHYGCYACHTIPGFTETTPPGTELTAWSERPIGQLDFSLYDHAFHHIREEQEETFGHVYTLHAEELNSWSPGDNAKEQITHTHAAFAKHKMLNPRIWDRQKIKKPYDKLKMPNFYLSDGEAEALTTYLMSRRSPRVSEEVKVDYDAGTAGAIAKGRDLTRELNCIGCHEIEDNAPTIQQYFRRMVGGKPMFDALNAPPSLWGEGAKVQHSWLHRFFQHVEPLRPWLTVRMPTFNLTNEQSTILVEYFAALSRQDSNTLAAALTPVNEFVKASQESESARMNGTSPGASEKKPSVPRWFEQDPLRRWTARLRRFALERKLIRPIEVDPLRTPAERLATGHANLLTRTEFMQQLYDVAFPFVEPPRPLSPTARFETGSKFFNDMGCLKCHVLGEMLPGPAKNTDEFIQMYRLDGVRGEGDKAVALLNGQPYSVGSVIDGLKLISAENVYYPSGDVDTKAVVEGPNATGETERVVLGSPSAPNLSLTHRRLRRDWVVAWMLQPDWIQPGTKMPQNFLDGKSPYEGDSKYPGAGMDHVNLLVDFLYDAGTRGTRAPLVKSLAAKTSGEFDEDGKPAQEEFKED